MMEIFKSATETSFMRNHKGGTGKPRKRETQIWSGNLSEVKRNHQMEHRLSM